jgi:hypothetical protein
MTDMFMTFLCCVDVSPDIGVEASGLPDDDSAGGFPPYRQLVPDCRGRWVCEVERCGDEAGVAEGLWRVAEVASNDRVVFLAEQADVVAEGQQAVEQLGGVIRTADSVEGIDKPERACQEGAFVAVDAVDVRALVANGVAEDESVAREVSLDGIDCVDYARVCPGQESVARHQEDRCVQTRGTV